jgi:hypothetical protein
MSKKLIDPDLAVHPLRLTMTDEDWDRLNRIFTENSDEDMSNEEVEAYTDWLYDEIAVRKQTHYGITTLQ